VLLFQELVKPH
jgi:hypothetical protein